MERSFLTAFMFGVSLVFITACASAEQEQSEGVSPEMAHVTVNDSVAGLLKHPAFAGYAQKLLPWDNRAYDERLLLKDVSSLLPFHSHVAPDTVVAPINRMIDDVSDGKTVFYDFYSRPQKQQTASKENTGLFFFRGTPGAPFAVVCPGGGFAYVGSLHEGFPYALELSDRGYNAFVLKYRAGGQEVATQDLAAAISYIFENAGTLRVGTENYSLWGSSAGARMAALIGSHGTSAFGGADLRKPATVVMAYTGHSDYSADEPPTFALVGDRDSIASPQAMERRIDALRKSDVDVEFHIYPNVGHGFGLGINTSAEGWIENAIRFWEHHMS